MLVETPWVKEAAGVGGISAPPGLELDCGQQPWGSPGRRCVGTEGYEPKLPLPAYVRPLAGEEDAGGGGDAAEVVQGISLETATLEEVTPQKPTKVLRLDDILSPEADKSPATPAFVLRLEDMLDELPELGSPERPTVGSGSHASGVCKPCAFVAKPEGCQSGVECKFCHLCEPGEKRRRRKGRQEIMRLHKQLSSPLASTPDVASAVLAAGAWAGWPPGHVVDWAGVPLQQ